MDTNQLSLTKYIYHLFSLLLIVGFFFFTTTSNAQAQQLNSARAQVVSVDSKGAQLTGGISVMFDDVEVSSQIGAPTINDLTPGTWMTIEEGQYVGAQTTPTNMVFRAQRVYVERLQDLLVSGQIEKIDPAGTSVTVLGKEIFIDGETKLLKKKKKKTKTITINDLAPGMVVTIEAILIDNNIVARKLTQGFSGFGSQPTVVGFSTNVSANRIVETTGGFLIDLSDFPVGGGIDLVPGMRTSFNIRDDKVSPFKVSGVGISLPAISFNAELEAVDPVNKTVTVAKRTFVINDDTAFFGVLDFTDFEVGKQAFLSFVEVNGQFIATGFGQ